MDLIFIFVAYAAGLAVKMIKLPTLVGYLLAGLALSLAGFTADEVLKQIGDLGVIFLLFTVGLHIRVRNVVQPEVLGVGGIHLLISTLLYGGLLLLIGTGWTTAVLIAIGLGFSSTVLTAKALEARDELDAYHGRIAIGILILQDLVAVGLLAVTGTAVPSLWAVGLLALPLARPLLLRLLTFTERDDLLLLFGVLLALGAGGLFEIVGLDAKLGALVAGVLLSGNEQADQLYDKLWGIKELFLVGFFLQVGLSGFPSLNGLLLVAGLLLLLPLKAVLFFVLLIAFRLRARTAFMTSLALAAYSEFALIVATAAAASGLVPAEMVTALALLVALSYAVNAPVNQIANRLWERFETTLVRFERHNVEHPDHPPASFGSADYVIVGMGRAGAAAYEFLVQHGERPLGLDTDPGKIATNLQAGRRVLFGDAQDPELWRNLSLDGVAAVLLAVPNVRAKIRSAHVLRSVGYTGPISALVRDVDDYDALHDAGVHTVGLPLIEAGRELAEVSMRRVAAPAV